MGMMVTLEDIYKGSAQTIKRRHKRVCRSCRLRPELPRCKSCSQCPPGIEVRRRWIDDFHFYPEEIEIPSPEKCKTEMELFEVTIEKGTMSGGMLTFANRASQLPKQIPGHIIVTVNSRAHKLFQRRGNDLQVTVPVSLSEALLGFQRQLTHLDGHVVKFATSRGQVLKPGAGLKIQGEGMPIKGEPHTFGSLIIDFVILFPDEVRADKIDQLEAGLQGIGMGTLNRRITKSWEDNEKHRRRSEL